MRMRYGRAGVGAALAFALPFLQGLLIELRAEDAIHAWPTIVAFVMIPWLLALLASLAFTLRHEMEYAAAIVLGVTIGFMGGVFLLVGDFAPYALELGGRRLAEFGDTLEVEWDYVLAFLAIVVGVVGGMAGAVCGPAVLALKRLLVARAG